MAHNKLDDNVHGLLISDRWLKTFILKNILSRRNSDVTKNNNRSEVRVTGGSGIHHTREHLTINACHTAVYALDRMISRYQGLNLTVMKYYRPSISEELANRKVPSN